MTALSFMKKSATVHTTGSAVQQVADAMIEIKYNIINKGY